MYERTRCLLAFGLALALGACDSGGGGGDGGATTTASGCPADVQPASASETPCSEEGLVCDYGSECCCGSCAPSYICTCYGENGWSCNYTDHCLGGGFCGSGGAGASGGAGGTGGAGGVGGAGGAGGQGG